ncbi:MAG TPA: ABC transporter ATP-binding protein [Gaiellaceae bacterium]|nr:ABC transporter ATP-binding protein [Gaiellaceae bacterium]
MSVRQQVASQGAAASSDDAVLDVQAMTTEVRVRRGVFKAVDGVSFAVGRGEILGIVGESGCGKTMTALTLMRLLPPSARVQGGHAWLDGVDLLSLSPAAMRRVRGKEISMVFQEPMTSLDPAFTVGDQIVETIRAHEDVGKEEALERAVRILEDVGIPNSGKRLRDYPHQFSGGMRQRVMLAIALVLRPKLVVADEPTTALDVTIQAQILELIAALRSEFGMSVILITHNLGVVHEVADRVAIMYAGEIVETGPVREIFADPRHPYTQGLLRSIPGLATRGRHLPVIPGRVPELSELPPACRFAPRCANRIERCEQVHPRLEAHTDARELRCYNPTPLARR